MLIDSHCHLDAPEFDADRDAVLARARAVGVRAQVLPAVAADAWPGLRRLCADQPDLFPAYGLHPMYLDRHRPEHLDRLEAWLADGDAVAVGECGLDLFVPGLDPNLQRRYFLRQLELAKAFDLPVIIHARRAVEETVACLRRIPGLRGVIHSFSGSPEQARQLAAIGFLIGIGGPVTYPRANRLRNLVANVPIERLLLETDAPDQPDIEHRGQRNEPARLGRIVSEVAALRAMPEAELAQAISANAIALFRLPLSSSAANATDPII